MVILCLLFLSVFDSLLRWFIKHFCGATRFHKPTEGESANDVTSFLGEGLSPLQFMFFELI